MTKLKQKLESLLREELELRLNDLPFGYGEEEGCEGFPKWSIYVNKTGELYGCSLNERDENLSINLSVIDKILSLPIERVVALLEHGFNGDDLFHKINSDFTIRKKMIYQARKDAEDWKENKTKIKLK